MTRGWKIALGVGGGLVVLHFGLQALGSLTGGTPGGPRSSAYATGDDGLAAYADLLGRAGHRVERVREPAARARLDPGSTVVLLDPGIVPREDAAALRSFVDAGGRLVAGGQPTGWLGPLLDSPPRWSSESAGTRRLAPAPETGPVRGVAASGGGSWETSTGGALPVLGDEDRALLAVAGAGRGRVLLLADGSVLQNRNLGRADNAALGLALAGPASRPVVFLERYHGYGSSSGVAAIPGPWKTALALAFIAALVFVLSRARRLGPPEPAARPLPPPRQEYVDSLGGVLARTKKRASGTEGARRRALELLARRAGLGAEDGDAEVRVAAARLGLSEAEIEALLRPAARDADVVALGFALARLERESAMVRT